ncbi:hypothetical protein [Rhodopirellula sp. MGV]|uniref:hypothetical protein n=1 Tax=Rhodopirellula sp. MGV TaxID=2023130 RepID=UPI000B95E419|nr:hypothetical protein [Rhodopirellula sp. MGV]OYP34905.1 hypothetical protein CGZ80_12795 [Rhodopirellula sp. MGV]PNY38198.1 hypothetical protein C2E31_04155 [Rhodopirellula baltica]
MKRVVKNIAVAAAITATSLGSAVPAMACGGSRPRVISRYTGHYSGGYGYSRPANYSTNYSVPTPPIRYNPAVSQQPSQPQPLPQSAQSQRPAQAVNPVPAASNPPRPAAPQASQMPASQTAAQSPSQPVATQDAEASALAALAALAGVSASTPAPATSAPQPAAPVAGHVGTFRATLPSNLAVDLQLAADGTFSWTVDNNGTPKSFSGQYRLEGGQLTLVRSTDLQKMAGTFVVQGNGFKFTLDGANNGGLEFQRV